MDATKRYIVALLNWDKMYHGANTDAGQPLLAPGIWTVALCTDAYKTYEVDAPSDPAKALEHLFEVCNIGVPRPYRDRSLSVGDLVIDQDSGRIHLCCSVGWHELPAEVTRYFIFEVLTKKE